MKSVNNFQILNIASKNKGKPVIDKFPIEFKCFQNLII